jgi:hypothetical protein
VITIPPESTSRGGPFGAVGVRRWVSSTQARNVLQEERVESRRMASAEVYVERISLVALASHSGWCRR